MPHLALTGASLTFSDIPSITSTKPDGFDGTLVCQTFEPPFLVLRQCCIQETRSIVWQVITLSGLNSRRVRVVSFVEKT